jgi:Tfp pilus assembly major pilin PilA
MFPSTNFIGCFMKARIRTTRINRGLSLVSVAVALGIVLIASPIGMEKYSNYLDEQVWTVTATHLSTVNQGARQYVKDNYDTILTQVKGGGNVTVTGQTLRDKGYLPAGFSLTNNSGQSYLLAVTRNATQTDKLIAFVLTTGGQDMAFKAQRFIAQNTAGLGGYVYPANMANGAGGGWQVNLSSMGLSGQSGHLATYLTSDVLAGGAEESDRLYRYAVNGRPDLNRMHTAIDLNANNVNNGGTLNAKDGNFSAAVTATTGTFSGNVSASAGTFQGNVNAATGTFNQKVTAGSDITSNGGWLVTGGSYGWMNSTHKGGWTMTDDNWVKSVNDKGVSTGGQMKGGTVRSDGRLSTGDVLGLDKVSVAGAACSNVGDVSRDAAGAILSCQSGVWKGIGIGNVSFSQVVRQGQTVNIGTHAFCALSQASYDYNNWRSCQVTRNSNGTWQLSGANVGSGEATCRAVCF